MSHTWEKYFNFLESLISWADLRCHQKRIQGKMQYCSSSVPLDRSLPLKSICLPWFRGVPVDNAAYIWFRQFWGEGGATLEEDF